MRRKKDFLVLLDAGFTLNGISCSSAAVVINGKRRPTSRNFNVPMGGSLNWGLAVMLSQLLDFRSLRLIFCLISNDLIIWQQLLFIPLSCQFPCNFRICPDLKQGLSSISPLWKVSATKDLDAPKQNSTQNFWRSSPNGDMSGLVLPGPAWAN